MFLFFSSSIGNSLRPPLRRWKHWSKCFPPNRESHWRLAISNAVFYWDSLRRTQNGCLQNTPSPTAPMVPPHPSFFPSAQLVCLVLENSHTTLGAKFVEKRPLVAVCNAWVWFTAERVCLLLTSSLKVIYDDLSECQTADWKTHKSTCHSLKGGSWHKIQAIDPLQLAPVNSPGAKPPYSLSFNRLDATQTEWKNTVCDGRPPPDVHDRKVFLAKFQLSISSNATPRHMLIYDRTKSFQLLWFRKSDPELFDEGTKMMGNKLKFYRWVRQTGDYEFDLFLDRAPGTDPIWWFRLIVSVGMRQYNFVLRLIV